MTLPGTRQTPNATRLVIPGFARLDLSSHWFNELLHFRSEGLALGLTPRILVPRSTDERVTAAIEADRVLEPLPGLEVNAENFVQSAATFADAADLFAPLRAWLAAENLNSSDIIYFPQGHPVLIRGIAIWLSKQAAGKRPAVFFRIIGDELTDLDTGRFKPRAAFYRLASADLDRAPGQERVFFLVNSKAKARSVSRVLRRQPFMMQHHFGRTADPALAAETAGPTVYVHVNTRSGRCLANLHKTIEHVCAIEPAARFLIKPAGDIAETMAALRLDANPFVELLPLEMDAADYFRNLARSTLVLLAYEAQPYQFLTSGVFTEAASMGKPVIVPDSTWMAEKIADGYGVGMPFADHSTMSDVILNALRLRRQLTSAARQLAPRLAEETGGRRFIETMVALSKTEPDVTPRYRIGDEIDFGDALDSRDFMKQGWGETERWGTWSIDSRAGVSLRLAAKPDRALFLNAFAFGHVPRPDHAVNVRVRCGDTQIAEWNFSSATEGGRARWLSAPLPGPEQLGDVLEFVFEVEGSTSPHAEGLSDDRRLLGLGVFKLSISEAGRTS